MRCPEIFATGPVPFSLESHTVSSYTTVVDQFTYSNEPVRNDIPRLDVLPLFLIGWVIYRIVRILDENYSHPSEGHLRHK